MTPAIEIVDLELAHRDATVLRGVSMEVRDGETVALVGPSGSGKSTLVRAVLGLAAPRRGVIRIRGREVSAGARSVVPPEERHLAVVFQNLALWPHMTVGRQLDFVLASRGVGRGERRARAAALLEQVGLASRESALPGELSGGEQQRLALARALVQEPAALLLDEPFTSLDVALKAELIELLGSLLRERGLYLAFRRHRDTLIVLVNLPLALIGGVFAVALGTGVLSVATLVGFVTLFGIATRNGVLLVNNYQRLLAAGVPLDEAVRRGSEERLAPILMTALTAGLALVPLILAGGAPGNEIQSPMAQVILGGLLSSTFLNLVVVPVLFAGRPTPSPTQ